MSECRAYALHVGWSAHHRLPKGSTEQCPLFEGVVSVCLSLQKNTEFMTQLFSRLTDEATSEAEMTQLVSHL